MQFITSFLSTTKNEVEHTGLLFLFTCQPTKSYKFSRLGVNMRVHLLRKNYCRNFSSIRSAPLSYRNLYGNVQELEPRTAQNRPVSLNWSDYTIQAWAILPNEAREKMTSVLALKNYLNRNKLYSPYYIHIGSRLSQILLA